MVVHQLRNIGSFVPMILPLVKNLIQNPEIRQFGIYLLSYKWLKMFHINFKQIFKGEYFKAILEVYIFKGFIVSSFCHLSSSYYSRFLDPHHFLVIKEKELTLWLRFFVRLICVELLMCCIHES